MGATKGADDSVAGVRTITLGGTATTGDGPAFQIQRAQSLTMQFINNSAGAYTANLQASNNGTTFANVPTAVSATTAAVKAAPADGLGFKYYRLSHTGGVGTTDFTCIVAAVEAL